jgi:hypothetical protein
MKSGYKTTEFWMIAAATIISTMLASGVFPEGSVTLKMLGIAASILTALGYSVSRSFVKVADTKANVVADVVNKVNP